MVVSLIEAGTRRGSLTGLLYLCLSIEEPLTGDPRWPIAIRVASHVSASSFEAAVVIVVVGTGRRRAMFEVFSGAQSTAHPHAHPHAPSSQNPRANCQYR